jgi:hypothetical protein
MDELAKISMGEDPFLWFEESDGSKHCSCPEQSPVKGLGSTYLDRFADLG